MNGLSPRPYLIEGYTKTVCPHCFAERARSSDEDGVWKDGLLVSHDDAIWMRRFCEFHGETESLYEEDATLWRARAGWSAPTLQITPDRTGNFAAFPDGYRDGLPASHGQHTCILLLNITQRCNYSCPTCYASALAPGAPNPQPELPSIEEIRATVETMLARENGKLGVLMLSGGEPTVRDDLPALIEAVRDLPITRILLNTNGRRIARDDRFLAWLGEQRGRVEVYLQFDGFKASTYETLRGENVAAEKMRALERLNTTGVWTTLVATLKRGVNDDEIGAIVQLGLDTPRCAGVALQPVFGSGRNPGFDPQQRLTPTGVIRRLSEQSKLVGVDDFIPLPCSHPDCCDITYLLRDGKDQWRSLPQLLGREELRRWIGLVSNTISFENASDAVREMLRGGALARVFSEQLPTGALDLARDISWLCDCVPGLPEMVGAARARLGFKTSQSTLDASAARWERLAERTFRVTVKMFMDAHTFHEARIRQCCVHSGTFETNPRRYSFCWRWLFSDASDFPEAASFQSEIALTAR